MGYVNREIPFNENERNSKKGLYFIHDNLFKFIYRFIAPNASILELGETNAVMNVVKTQMPSFVAECWENLCRNFVSGNEIDGILYNKSSRWWGKIFTEDVPKGEMVELDVVAESFDKQHVLIGECKWTTEEDAERILFRLQRIAKYLPFVKHRQVHFAIFAKSRPVHSKMARLFLPEDVLS